jgi:hypothetical protein
MLALGQATVAQQIGVALAATSPGLVTSPFHFIATGYGLSVAALAVHTLRTALAQGKLAAAAAAHVSLLGLFGLRLAAFLHFRSQTESYAARPEMADVKKRMTSVPLAKRVLMWISVSVMYVAMCAPARYTAVSPPPGLPPTIHSATVLGLCGMAAGLGLEAVADQHKSALKAKDARKFCNTGLYAQKYLSCEICKVNALGH